MIATIISCQDDDRGNNDHNDYYEENNNNIELNNRVDINQILTGTDKHHSRLVEGAFRTRNHAIDNYNITFVLNNKDRIKINHSLKVTNESEIQHTRSTLNLITTKQLITSIANQFLTPILSNPHISNAATMGQVSQLIAIANYVINAIHEDESKVYLLDDQDEEPIHLFSCVDGVFNILGITYDTNNDTLTIPSLKISDFNYISELLKTLDFNVQGIKITDYKNPATNEDCVLISGLSKIQSISIGINNNFDKKISKLLLGNYLIAIKEEIKNSQLDQFKVIEALLGAINKLSPLDLINDIHRIILINLPAEEGSNEKGTKGSNERDAKRKIEKQLSFGIGHTILRKLIEDYLSNSDNEKISKFGINSIEITRKT